MKRIRHDVRGVRRQQGFSFFEVLIAALVLGIGVLGFAALQVRALDTTGVSHFRAQAAIIAADLSERTRMATAAIPDVNDIVAIWDANTAIPAALPTGANSCYSQQATAGGCTAQQLVAADVQEMRFLSDQLLPGGNIDLRPCAVGSGLTCVFVAWRGQQAADCEPGDGLANCLSVQVLF